MEFFYLLRSNLLRVSQKSKIRLARFCFVFIVIVIFIFIFLDNKDELRFNSTNAEVSQLGLKIFSEMVYYIVLITTIILPFIVAPSVIAEKKTRGIESLLLYPNMGKVILNRYIATICILFLYYIGTLPIFLLCMYLGGINGMQIIYSYLMMWSYIAFVVSVCFFVTAESTYTIQAVLFSYIFGGIFLIGFTIILVNPLMGLYLALHGWSVYWYYILSFLVNIFVAILLLKNAVKRFFSDISLKEIFTNTKKTKSYKKPLEDKKNAILWRDQQYFVHYAIRICCNFSSLILFYFVIGFFYYSYHESIFRLLLISNTIIAFISSLFLFYEEPKSFELLLLSNYPPHEILRQKLLNILHNLFWPLTLSVITCIFYLIMFRNQLHLHWHNYMQTTIFIMSLITTILFNSYITLHKKSLKKAFKFIFLFAFFAIFINAFVEQMIITSNHRIQICYAYSLFMLCIQKFLLSLLTRKLTLPL